MATTFTGLKLQGALGKACEHFAQALSDKPLPHCAAQFGASELSDISGFVELPDGKIVSGTECRP